MLERKIQSEWVERAVIRPEFVRNSPTVAIRRMAFRRIEELGKRWLRVLYENEGPEIVVVSVYVDRSAEKWR